MPNDHKIYPDAEDEAFAHLELLQRLKKEHPEVPRSPVGANDNLGRSPQKPYSPWQVREVYRPR